MHFKRFVKLELNGELIHLAKQVAGDAISVLTKVDKYLTEELFVVAAYFVVGEFGHFAFELQDEDFGECVSFFHVQHSDEGVKALAVVEVVASGVNLRFVREEGRIYFFCHQNASNGAAFVCVCFCIFFHMETFLDFFSGFFFSSFDFLLLTFLDLNDNKNDLKECDCSSYNSEEDLRFFLVCNVASYECNEERKDIANEVANGILNFGHACASHNGVECHKYNNDYSEGCAFSRNEQAGSSEGKYSEYCASCGKYELKQTEPSRFTVFRKGKDKAKYNCNRCDSNAKQIKLSCVNFGRLACYEEEEGVRNCAENEEEESRLNATGCFLRREDCEQGYKRCNDQRNCEEVHTNGGKGSYRAAFKEGGDNTEHLRVCGESVEKSRKKGSLFYFCACIEYVVGKYRQRNCAYDQKNKGKDAITRVFGLFLSGRCVVRRNILLLFAHNKTPENFFEFSSFVPYFSKKNTEFGN